jgi:hypothetical protein
MIIRPNFTLPITVQYEAQLGNIFGAEKLRLSYLLLRVLQLLQTGDGSSDSRSSRGSELPAASGDLLLASLARPDTGCLSSDGILSAE